jgi:hypothetical protein
MKAIFGMMGGFALAAAAWAMAWAQEVPTPAAGHVLVLDNERVLEGEVTRDGECFHIRRDASELTVPATKTLTVCSSMVEAYQFLCTRANLGDPDEHLRLARWCLLHELREQAIAEAATAVSMRPSHAESRQVLALIQHSTAASPVGPAAPPEPRIEADLVLSVSTECLALFTTKVQPILMNICASCHASGRGGAFVLVRSFDAAGRKTAQQNLTAALKQISFDQPNASPLLVKAVCAHGGAAAPPLVNRDEEGPLATLEQWVNLVAARHPHLAVHGAKAIAGASVPCVVAKTEPVARHLPPPDYPVNAPLAPPARVVDRNLCLTDPGESPQPRPVVQPAAAPAVDDTDEYSPKRFNLPWHGRP